MKLSDFDFDLPEAKLVVQTATGVPKPVPAAPPGAAGTTTKKTAPAAQGAAGAAGTVRLTHARFESLTVNGGSVQVRSAASTSAASGRPPAGGPPAGRA